MSELTLYGCVVSTVGRIRSNNEDNFNLFGKIRSDVKKKDISAVRKSKISKAYVAVYDGMGGEEAGEVASLIAARKIKGCEFDMVETVGKKSVLDANELICRESLSRNLARVGTTMAGAYFGNDSVKCCNIGDSRCYIYRNGIIKLLSKDHSEGQRLIDTGVLTEEEARNSRAWHQLTQHLGIFPEEFIIEPYYSEEIELTEGDILLLCSDGLTDVLTSDDLKFVFGNNNFSNEDLPELADKLVKQALDKKSRDNITVVLVKVNEKKTFMDRIFY